MLGSLLHGGRKDATATFTNAITSSRRAQAGRTQIRTAIQRCGAGRALHGMARTAGQKRQDRLQEAVQKRIASGHQAYPTEKRRAGATARLTGTMREALPDHEHAVEQFETAGPAPPRFVTVDLAHIRSGILRHALCAAAADQAQQGVVGPDGIFCSGHAKGKAISAFIPDAALVRA